LRDKCDILWAQLDALHFAYVEPGWPPPGAFQIDAEPERG
jgi:pyrroloquinoline-quinone synthase